MGPGGRRKGGIYIPTKKKKNRINQARIIKRTGGRPKKKVSSRISFANTFNTIRLRQLCTILHQRSRNLIPTRITRRQAEVNVCARDIVCVELYTHRTTDNISEFCPTSKQPLSAARWSGVLIRTLNRYKKE